MTREALFLCRHQVTPHASGNRPIVHKQVSSLTKRHISGPLANRPAVHKQVSSLTKRHISGPLANRPTVHKQVSSLTKRHISGPLANRLTVHKQISITDKTSHFRASSACSESSVVFTVAGAWQQQWIRHFLAMWPILLRHDITFAVKGKINIR